MSEQAAANTDREIWRKGDGDGNGMSHYEPSIHVTINELIGISVGGTTFEMPVEDWHAIGAESFGYVPCPLPERSGTPEALAPILDAPFFGAGGGPGGVLPSEATERECWCCGRPVEPRDPDPWEGRMVGYCYECATTRCDTTDGECSFKPAAVSSPVQATGREERVAEALVRYDGVLAQAQAELVKRSDDDFYWEDRVRDFVNVVRDLRKRHRRVLAFARTAAPSPDSGSSLAAVSVPPEAAAQEIIYIARCPEHGLHGERAECFECGGPVEKVPMVELAVPPEAPKDEQA